MVSDPAHLMYIWLELEVIERGYIDYAPIFSTEESVRMEALYSNHTHSITSSLNNGQGAFPESDWTLNFVSEEVTD